MSVSSGSPALTGVRTPGEFRDLVRSLGDERCAAGVFESCLRPIVYSRHHSLLFKGEYRVRAELRGLLEELAVRDPREWDDEECDLVLALYALSASAVGLDELRERVDTAEVREVLRERHDLYAPVLGSPAEVPSGLLELADRVSELRRAVERTHHLYSIIDGEAWFRTEGVLARSDVADDRFTEPVERVVGVEFGVPQGATVATRLEVATRDCLADHGDSAPLVRALMVATLEDPVLRADHVTITVPNGDLLDTPELMTTSEAFFTETQLRDDLGLDAYRERLGHESAEQLQRTIRARMLKLKRGAIRSMYGPGCLHGRFVEKHGGHMIFRNEDAHYRGHQSIGCSSGGRASFALRYRSGDESRELTPMVGDYRVVRMSHDEGEIFTGGELTQVIRYAEWLRIVVEETYRNGCVIRAAAAVSEVPAPRPAAQ